MCQTPISPVVKVALVAVEKRRIEALLVCDTSKANLFASFI